MCSTPSPTIARKESASGAGPPLVADGPGRRALGEHVLEAGAVGVAHAREVEMRRRHVAQHLAADLERVAGRTGHLPVEGDLIGRRRQPLRGARHRARRLAGPRGEALAQIDPEARSKSGPAAAAQGRRETSSAVRRAVMRMRAARSPTSSTRPSGRAAAAGAAQKQRRKQAQQARARHGSGSRTRTSAAPRSSSR